MQPLVAQAVVDTQQVVGTQRAVGTQPLVAQAVVDTREAVGTRQVAGTQVVVGTRAVDTHLPAGTRAVDDLLLADRQRIAALPTEHPMRFAAQLPRSLGLHSRDQQTALSSLRISLIRYRALQPKLGWESGLRWLESTLA